MLSNVTALSVQCCGDGVGNSEELVSQQWLAIPDLLHVAPAIATMILQLCCGRIVPENTTYGTYALR